MLFIGLAQPNQLVLPLMVDFTIEQENYINSSINEHIYLEACSGSGKTEVVAAKVAKEINTWNKNPSGMAILSFSNSATNELKTRIRKFCPATLIYYPHFTGTFDSFIFKYIVSPIGHKLTGYKGKHGDFSIRIIDNNSNLNIQTAYSYAKKGKQKAHQYDYDLNTKKIMFNHPDKKVNKTLNSIVMEEWQEDMFKNAKASLAKAGFATYRDIELLAIDILNSPDLTDFTKNIVKRFPFIIIDECQDLAQEQLLILTFLSNLGVKLHFVGDLNQSIYGFRNANPENIMSFIKYANFKVFPLPQNHRSVQSIVDLCSTLVKSNKIVGQPTSKVNHCLILEYNNCPTEVLSSFLTLSKNYDNSVIVARGHTILNKFNTSSAKLNEVQKLALAITLFNPNNFNLLEKSITLFSEYLRSKLKGSVRPQSFNCPESTDSPLRWRQFVFNVLKYLIDDNLNDTSIKWKDWCRGTKYKLRDVLSKSFVDDDISKLLSELNNVNISSPAGLSEECIALSLKLTEQKPCDIRKATIHAVKGETHDVTMLISSADARGKVGSCWEEWLSDPSSEAARLAYVASSRPKELLIWSVKKLKNNEKCKLIRLGFKIVSND